MCEIPTTGKYVKMNGSCFGLLGKKLRVVVVKPIPSFAVNRIESSVSGIGCQLGHQQQRCTICLCLSLFSLLHSVPSIAQSGQKLAKESREKLTLRRANKAKKLSTPINHHNSCFCFHQSQNRNRKNHKL